MLNLTLTPDTIPVRVEGGQPIDLDVMEAMDAILSLQKEHNASYAEEPCRSYWRDWVAERLNVESSALPINQALLLAEAVIEADERLAEDRKKKVAMLAGSLPPTVADLNDT